MSEPKKVDIERLVVRLDGDAVGSPLDLQVRLLCQWARMAGMEDPELRAAGLQELRTAAAKLLDSSPEARALRAGGKQRLTPKALAAFAKATNYVPGKRSEVKRLLVGAAATFHVSDRTARRILDEARRLNLMT